MRKSRLANGFPYNTVINANDYFPPPPPGEGLEMEHITGR